MSSLLSIGWPGPRMGELYNTLMGEWFVWGGRGVFIHRAGMPLNLFSMIIVSEC